MLGDWEHEVSNWDLMAMIEYLIDNIDVHVGNKVFLQFTLFQFVLCKRVL